MNRQRIAYCAASTMIKMRGNLAYRSSRGVALISILLIVTVVIFIVSAVFDEFSFLLTRTSLTKSQAQTKQYCLGAEQYAKFLLYDDLVKSDSRVDTPEDSWFLDKPQSFDFEEGVLNIVINDLSSKLNLNAIAGEEGKFYHEAFARLLEQTGVDPRYADVWGDWIDQDEEPRESGQEDGYYLSLADPFRTPNQVSTDLSEFILITGISVEEFQLILPWITLLPETGSKLNIHTAPNEVLSSLRDSIDVSALRNELKVNAPLQTKEEIKNKTPSVSSIADHLDIYSEYFEILIEGEYFERHCHLKSVLYRDDANIYIVGRNFKPFSEYILNPFHKVENIE